MNGQKIWAWGAAGGDGCYLIARTDAGARPHEGLSELIVDMRAPGVEVRPLHQITGEAEFNEVFFTDARMPDDARLGAVGDGWRVAVTTLMNERVATAGGVFFAVAPLAGLTALAVWVVVFLVVRYASVASMASGAAIPLAAWLFGEPWPTVGNVLNWGTWLVFATEVVVMMCIVPSRKYWLRHHPLDVAVTVLTPPFAPAAWQAGRLYRVLRLMRLLRVFSLRRLLSLDGLKVAALTAVIAAQGANIDRIERLSRYPITSFELTVSGADGPDGQFKLRLRALPGRKVRRSCRSFSSGDHVRSAGWAGS